MYVYLLGLYLGDGCITRTPRTYVLRIFLNENQPHPIAEAARAISQLVPMRRVGLDRRGRRVIMRAYYTRPRPIIMSIARRPDVARLDAIMGHSWSDPSEPATTPA